MNYYNEHDPKTAAWLRELIDSGLIPAGIVDERSIVDVRADELHEFTQCHFFAGIGGWSLALQLAGWPADRLVWTGSCPCQPFSTAGKGLAQADERHLWPVFFNLIRQCRPPIVFGEQVASAAVVGHSDKNKSMQSVRDRKTLLRILQELKRGTARNLQGLREDEGASAEKKQVQDGKGRLQKMEGRETRLCSCERGEAQSQEFWATIRPLGREHSGKDRQGGLRSDGNTLRPIDSALLERPFIGPDCATSRIYPGEHSGGLVCPECHGELMGASTDSGGVERDSWVEERSLEQLIRLNRDETSGTPEECWLDGISADLEAEGYACGAVVLGAHSVQSPHQRQRLYWVADGKQSGLEGQSRHGNNGGESRRINQDTIRPTSESGAVSGMVLSDGDRCSAGSSPASSAGYRSAAESAGGGAGWVGNANSEQADAAEQRQPMSGEGLLRCWDASRLVHCRDGKARRIPTEPAFFPLAHGIPARVVRLRGYGNAIVPQVAAEFIQAFEETLTVCLPGEGK